MSLLKAVFGASAKCASKSGGKVVKFTQLGPQLPHGPFSFHSVSQVAQLSWEENAIIVLWKSAHETGAFHACLYSLRDYPHGSG